MNPSTKEKKKSNRKKNLIEWAVIGSVILLLYVTGLHTQVIGTMQRALLWTGLMNANPVDINENAPFLTEQNYRFMMATNDGETETLDQMRGSVVFVNIWASWCPPCIAEMPTIESLYLDLKNQDNIHFVLLSMDDDRQKAVNFMERRNFTVPYHFPESAIPSVLHATLLPTTYVISKEGQIVYEKRGIAPVPPVLLPCHGRSGGSCRPGRVSKPRQKG